MLPHPNLEYGDYNVYHDYQQEGKFTCEELPQAAKVSQVRMNGDSEPSN